ncbi:hypothetical protein [Leptodesmis sichuanensis]|uniref:hypothetical protein n=1 Tax=Leptodesmis sichuanensis TaxID=2906798 RepID=UPI001F18795E|nr:hypothetical protein [Leptodesmis sichuanensis]UIE36779.1 hypothetical protein KIK02_17365 [Leptodesmis sichuanensis A121]
MNRSDSFCTDLHPGSLATFSSPAHPTVSLHSAYHFYASCDRDTQGLLRNCTWGFITKSAFLTLLIKCPSTEVYWHILTSLSILADRIAPFSYQARIRVYPPVGQGTPLELGVEEITAHLGW